MHKEYRQRIDLSVSWFKKKWDRNQASRTVHHDKNHVKLKKDEQTCSENIWALVEETKVRVAEGKTCNISFKGNVFNRSVYKNNKNC